MNYPDIVWRQFISYRDSIVIALLPPIVTPNTMHSLQINMEELIQILTLYIKVIKFYHCPKPAIGPFNCEKKTASAPAATTANSWNWMIFQSDIIRLVGLRLYVNLPWSLNFVKYVPFLINLHWNTKSSVTMPRGCCHWTCGLRLQQWGSSTACRKVDGM